MAVTASDARKRLFPLIKQVNDDRVPVEVVARSGERAYLVAADDFESMAETDYLLQSPANAARLLEAVADVRSGQGLAAKSMDALRTIADEDEGS